MKDDLANTLQAAEENDQPPQNDTINRENNANDRLWRIVVATVLVLLPLIYFFPAVMGKVTLAPGDGWPQIFGIRLLIGQMIRDGQLPLWNPYVFAGMPLLAGIINGALYPPTWLFAVFSPQTAMNVMVITTYHIALIGTYFYARRIGANRTGAIVAGVAFTFGGYMVTHLGHTDRIAAAAWLPWILLAVEELYLRWRWRWVSLGALFIALQVFAGEPQMTCYSAIVVGAYGIFSLTLRPAEESRLRFLAGAMAMSVCGVLLSMILLLPAGEMLRFGERAAIDYEYFSQFSFPPRQVFSLLAPYFFGGASLDPYRVSYWGAWNLTETCGYAGTAALLLALIAVISQASAGSRNRLIWFWALCAIGALLLAFGSHLPFGIHRLLYEVPVYKLFRASGRHLFEFNFAIGILAGLGVTVLTRMERRAARRAMFSGLALMSLAMTAAVVVYCFFDERLVSRIPLPPAAGSLANPDIFVPVVFFIFGAAALLIHSRRWSRVSGGALASLLFLDLMAFGFFYEWRLIDFDVQAKLADPPSVKFIKSREPDLNSFRTISHTAGNPFVGNTDLLNYPNVSIARGLQSVNGYDPLRLWRMAEIVGTMTLDGYVAEANTFTSAHQGLNLLNAKYLLYDAPGVVATNRITIEDVEFGDPPMGFMMTPGVRTQIDQQGMATELVVITSMGNSDVVPNNTPVVSVRIHTADNKVIVREILAGRDTSEWAYDREDVKAKIRHDRARVIESWDVVGFQGHRYIARLTFPRSNVRSVGLEYLLRDSGITIHRASLYDSETKSSVLLNNLSLPPERWREIASFGSVMLYENQKAMPRAWFAPRVAIMPSVDVLETIKSSRTKDDSEFNPSETVLLESEIFGSRYLKFLEGDPSTASAPKGAVKITRYEPQRIELQTSNQRTEFLVLSEIYYRGWEAWIDGQRTPVERVNYTLRGIIVAAGEHRIEFAFRAPSFRNGAVYSLLGIVVLLTGAGLSRVRKDPHVSGILKRLTGLKWSWLFTIAALIGLLIYGAALVKHAAYAVGGSDSSGYARIARSLLQGSPERAVTELDQLGLQQDLTHIFVPLAYTPGRQPKTMAPAYPVGFPLLVAAAALIGGWEYGPFLVSPLSGVISLILIFLIGRELGLTRGFSAFGSVMLAASPTFLFIALQPMSDVAATCWALVVIWAALRTRRSDAWALLAGAAFGISFLIRPTSVLLLVPLLFCLRLKPKVLLFFVLGGLPLAALFIAYNLAAYGYLLQAGYGSARHYEYLTFTNFTVRFKEHVYWLAMTMSSLPLLGWLAVAADRKVEWRNRALLITWFASFLLFYGFFDIYGDWWYTRFLLPGLPALILGTLLVVRDVAEPVRKYVGERNVARLRWAAVIILLAVVLGFEQHYIRHFRLFSTGKGHTVHATSSRWADRMLPDQALVASMEMSGALDFYTERLIVRSDLVAPDQWRLLKEHAAEKGYRWYALLMAQEVEDAQKNMPGFWLKLGNMGFISLWQIEPSSGKTEVFAAEASEDPAVEISVIYGQGFYDLELGSDGSSWRWMSQEGVIKLRNSRRDRLLKIEGGTPSAPFLPPATIKIQFNGELLDQVTTVDGRLKKVYTITAARQGEGAWSELRLNVYPSVVPKEVGTNGSDPRQLAFSLEKLLWEASEN